MEYSNWTLISLLLLLTNAVDISSGQNGTVSDSGSSGSQGGAVEEAMAPFYSMTNNFLDIVQPKSDESLLDWYLRDLEENSKFNGDNWKEYISKYPGFVVCLALGLLFVVVMPIIGLILCCCRCCCGKCGAHAESKHDKNDRASFYVCSALLFIFSMFILAGTILTFITNEYIWQQTTYNDKGVIYDTQETLRYLDTYKVNGKNDFVRLGTDMKVKIDSVILDVKELPRAIGDSYAESVNADDVLKAAQELQTSVQSIKSDLSTVDTTLNDLKTAGTMLVTKLNDIGSRMSSTLQGCPSGAASQCNTLRAKIINLRGLADFSKVDDVTQFLDSLRNIQLNDVYNTALTEFRKLENTLDQRIASELAKIEQIGADIKTDVDKTVNEVIKVIDNEIEFSEANEKITEVKPDIQEYGNYRKYCGIVIGCALLITGVLFFLGLLFGCFGSDPDSESACNKATGANLLMGGIVWAFVFSWILMIIVILFFVTGGLSYTEVCRNMVHLGQTPESIKTLRTVDRILEHYGIEENISSIVFKCKVGKGAYEAFNLSRFIDIDKEIGVERYDLQKELDRLKRLRLRIPAIDIINNQNYQQLEELGNANLQNIDFDSFYTELQYDFTNENLNTLATDADNVANLIRQSGDNNKANTLQSQATELRTTHSNNVSPMISTKSRLEIAVRSLERSVKGSSGTRVFSDYVTELKNSFDDLQYRLDRARPKTETLSSHIQTEAQRIYDDVKNYLDNGVKRRIKEEIGDCGGVYQRVNHLVTTSICERVVNPYNAFWFSVGWCLFFFIPSIIVAWDLNIQYRRIGYYGPDKGFEDHSFRY